MHQGIVGTIFEYRTLYMCLFIIIYVEWLMDVHWFTTDRKEELCEALLTSRSATQYSNGDCSYEYSA